MNNIQKAAVIGCGFVGSSIAFTLMQSGIFSELVLIDANRDKAEGQKKMRKIFVEIPLFN